MCVTQTIVFPRSSSTLMTLSCPLIFAATSFDVLTSSSLLTRSMSEGNTQVSTVTQFWSLLCLITQSEPKSMQRFPVQTQEEMFSYIYWNNNTCLKWLQEFEFRGWRQWSWRRLLGYVKFFSVIFRLHKLFLLFSFITFSISGEWNSPWLCTFGSDHKLKFILLCSVRVRSLPRRCASARRLRRWAYQLWASARVRRAMLWHTGHFLTAFLALLQEWYYWDINKNIIMAPLH